jgi:SAM-dependent methyltransferase
MSLIQAIQGDRHVNGRGDDSTFTAHYFAEIADLEARHPWPRALRALALELMDCEQHRSAGPVLDVGCGAGLFLNEWMKRGQLEFGVGVDLYAEALGWARKRENGSWVRAAAGDLPFQSGSFGAIHSADVLQHLSLKDSARALDSFAKLLRPGGMLALRVRAPRIFRSEPDADYAQSFPPQRLKSELERRGFELRFLSHVNALPSVWAEIFQTLRGASPEGAVKGIRLKPRADLSSRLLAAYLAIERFWLISLRLPLPLGHSIVCIARKLADR